MQTYETIFITTPTLSDEEEREAVEVLSSIVTDGGGKFTTNDRMGRRRLAYPIQKHNDGVYVRFLYDADAEVPKELERRIRLSDKILRVLTVKLEPNWAVAAKEQAIRDAEQAERDRIERADRERLEAQAAARGETIDGKPLPVEGEEAAPATTEAAASTEQPAAAPPATSADTEGSTPSTPASPEDAPRDGDS